jgi:hypothetical protein
VLSALRDAVRRREIWVAGATRWRDPEHDLPRDFDINRDVHYAALRQPTDPTAFIEDLKARLAAALGTLDTVIASGDAGVQIRERRGEPWISMPPIGKLQEPQNLAALKAEIRHRWGTVELLDILKETDWLVDFTSEFSSIASREIVPREVLRRRLLLCLFALGTNMGISQVIATGDHSETKATLRRARRMFITRENLRAAIARVVNATLEVRDQAWWGHGTACASDSQKFGAWSTNFMT